MSLDGSMASRTTVGYVRCAVWWNALALAAVVAAWILIPRWAALTSASIEDAVRTSEMLAR
jgi:hypothetical protein